MMITYTFECSKWQINMPLTYNQGTMCYVRTVVIFASTNRHESQDTFPLDFDRRRANELKCSVHLKVLPVDGKLTSLH